MARPSKYSDTVARRICKAIEAGATYKLAAKAGGVSYDTLNRWRKAREDFARRVEDAEWKAAHRWLDCIDEAAQNGDWRAAAWRLERRYPDQYGKYQTKGNDGDDTTDSADDDQVVTYLPDNGRRRHPDDDE